MEVTSQRKTFPRNSSSGISSWSCCLTHPATTIQSCYWSLSMWSFHVFPVSSGFPATFQRRTDWYYKLLQLWMVESDGRRNGGECEENKMECIGFVWMNAWWSACTQWAEGLVYILYDSFETKWSPNISFCVKYYWELLLWCTLECVTVWKALHGCVFLLLWGMNRLNLTK